jgi:hypothetical protein
VEANPVLFLCLIATIVAPPPTTKCPSCKYQEYSKFQQLFLGYPRESVWEVMRIAMGGIPYGSYQYHYEMYAEHGNPKELERMLRHVTIDPYGTILPIGMRMH